MSYAAKIEELIAERDELRQRVKELEQMDGWQWQHVAATTLARFVNHGTPFADDARWAEIADVATKLLTLAHGKPA